MVDATWVPSHLDPQLCTSPFEEWIAANNNLVDKLAVETNRQRSPAFHELRDKQKSWDLSRADALERLRSYYFAVFEATRTERPPVMIMNIVDSDDDEEGALYSFSDVLMPALEADSFVQHTGFPFAFWLSILGWVCQHESDQSMAMPVSYLELTFGLLKIDPISFPFGDPHGGGWKLVDRFTLFERPTLVYFLGIIKKVFKFVCSTWTTTSPSVSGLDRSSIGVYTPQQGVLMRLPSEFLARVRHSVMLFTRRRQIRRACDMARPVA